MLNEWSLTHYRRPNVMSSKNFAMNEKMKNPFTGLVLKHALLHLRWKVRNQSQMAIDYDLSHSKQGFKLLIMFQTKNVVEGVSDRMTQSSLIIAVVKCWPVIIPLGHPLEFANERQYHENWEDCPVKQYKLLEDNISGNWPIILIIVLNLLDCHLSSWSKFVDNDIFR